MAPDADPASVWCGTRCRLAFLSAVSEHNRRPLTPTQRAQMTLVHKRGTNETIHRERSNTKHTLLLCDPPLKEQRTVHARTDSAPRTIWRTPAAYPSSSIPYALHHPSPRLLHSQTDRPSAVPACLARVETPPPLSARAGPFDGPYTSLALRSCITSAVFCSGEMMSSSSAMLNLRREASFRPSA